MFKRFLFFFFFLGSSRSTKVGKTAVSMASANRTWQPCYQPSTGFVLCIRVSLMLMHFFSLSLVACRRVAGLLGRTGERVFMPCKHTRQHRRAQFHVSSRVYCYKIVTWCVHIDPKRSGFLAMHLLLYLQSIHQFRWIRLWNLHVISSQS